jgi:hypothetical protein
LTKLSSIVRVGLMTRMSASSVNADGSIWSPTLPPAGRPAGCFRLTGAEILELLGCVGPGIDAAYRDELVDRDFGRQFPYICCALSICIAARGA